MASLKPKRCGLTFTAFLVLGLFFSCCFSQTNQPQTNWKSAHLDGFGSSAVYQLVGSVYPVGYYYVRLSIGHPGKHFNLDIDTGSNITWVQCDYPLCTGCTMAPEHRYKPRNNFVLCRDPLCAALPSGVKLPCNTPNDHCRYKVEYADRSSSQGVLVEDYFPGVFQRGPRLAFGCGNHQIHSSGRPPRDIAGVLGLGTGKASIVSQLIHHLTRNVVGHCLRKQGGFLFIGNYLTPPGVVWTPMSNNLHYSSGPAELIFDGQPTGVNARNWVFDSGSTYTYFNSEVYRAFFELVRKNLEGKPLKVTTEDRSLPICWKGSKRFQSVHDVRDYFKRLALRFTNNVQLHISPDDYLIVSQNGNVCLGILNGYEVVAETMNIIGDITLVDKILIYDNENRRIGWAPADCNMPPKS